MNTKITKLSTLTLTLFLTTNLCAMEADDHSGKRKRESDTLPQITTLHMPDSPHLPLQAINPLYTPIKEQDFETAEKLLKEGADINAPHFGVTLLSLFTLNEFIEAELYSSEARISKAKWLLEHGANIFQRDPNTGLSVLDTLEKSYSNMPSSEDIKITRDYIHTQWETQLANLSLTLKAQNLPPEMMEKIIRHHLNATTVMLREVVKNGVPKTVERLLDCHYINKDTFLDMMGEEITSDESPLHVAAEAGNATVVTLLLDRKANVNAKNQNKETPLHKAVNFACSEKTFHRAAGLDHHPLSPLKTIETLLKNRANVNAKKEDNTTPLHTAVFKRRIDITTLLINYDADLDAQDRNGKTPMHYAYIFKNMPFINLLQIKGGDMSIKDIDDKTPEDYLNA